MNGRQLLGLVAGLTIAVPAFAAADQYLYKDTNLAATGVVAIQQHTVYVEIVKEEVRQEEQLHQFAAVVAVVKRCIRAERQFDNAVLWFNDQFLFGDKRRETRNVTSGPVLGSQPAEDHYDQNMNPTFDTDGTAKFIRRFGTDSGSPTGENGNSAPGQGPGRWVGCFVPEGFLHAIGSDDPYGVGSDALGSATSGALTTGDQNNIGLVKTLIGLDNSVNCNGCIFNYTGSFYITDPNGFNWIIDKYVYPAVLTGTLAKLNQAGNCADPPPSGGTPPATVDATLAEDVHVNSGGSIARGCNAEQHRDVAEDNNTVTPDEDDPNHCFDDAASPDVCDDFHNDPTDTPRQDSAKLTTLEPLYTVHMQVDPVDDQALRDEALWAWRSSGIIRPGAPRYEASPNTEPGAGAAGECPLDNTNVACSIEYTALIVVDFEAFDDVGVLFAEGQGENTITRNGKTHGLGGADDADESKSGNAHRHNPTPDDVPTDGFVDEAPACGASGGGTEGWNATDGGVKPGCGLHAHDTVTLDLFFMTHLDSECLSDARTGCGAPRFSVVNGGFRDGPSGATLTGRPPRATDKDCLVDDGTHGEGSAPLLARAWIVCDIDDDAEFHRHDGSQTITG